MSKFYRWSIVQFVTAFAYTFVSGIILFEGSLYKESSFAISPFIFDCFLKTEPISDTTFWCMDFILAFIAYSLCGIIESVLSYYFFDDFDGIDNTDS